MVRGVLGKRVSNNAKSISVIEILKLRTENEIEIKAKELAIKEREMALKEREMALKEKQFEVDRKERENVLQNLNQYAMN